VVRRPSKGGPPNAAKPRRGGPHSVVRCPRSRITRPWAAGSEEDLQGELQKRASKHKLDDRWVAKFFRPAKRRARPEPADKDGDETPPAK